MIIETGNPDNLTSSISAAKFSKFLLDKLIKFGIYSIPFAPLSFAKQTNSSINETGKRNIFDIVFSY